jgi:predicted nucleotidyltransferase component of viral defense system
VKKIALLGREDREVLFSRTAEKMKMHPSIVEKDFWVCFMLDHLFHDCMYKDAFVFKGGTSLSKSYHVIERFSEDIDLILDWRKLTNDTDPWDERSKTKQDQYNKEINSQAAVFYREELVPALNKELALKLGEGDWVEVDDNDPMVVNFRYPRDFSMEYLVPVVRLEIGPLAEWMPSHVTIVEPFAATQYPNAFEQRTTDILTIDIERTFWEKLTILHKMAYFPQGKVLPRRYARHLYDVYCMANSWVKDSAFALKELLQKDVVFKQKFYYAKSAHYETATLKEIKLIPADYIMDEVREDYTAMKNMIYGAYHDFDSILTFLDKLEDEIHNL